MTLALLSTFDARPSAWAETLHLMAKYFYRRLASGAEFLAQAENQPRPQGLCHMGTETKRTWDRIT